MAVQQPQTPRLQIIRRTACLLLFALTLSASCSKEEQPEWRGPAVARRTVLMYLPFSGPTQALTDYFEQNIADMETIVAQDLLQEERLLVYFMPAADEAELFELLYFNGKCVRIPRKKYPTPPAFTTPAGIASILQDAAHFAPADRYAMTIGCHGMAWIPARATTFRAGGEKEYWDWDGVPRTRWFGGTSTAYQTDITDLAAGIEQAGMKMDYILFDDCYMASVEVAYELRAVTDHLIGSTSEIMAFGFPYAKMGRHLFGEVDYEAICREFYDFYMAYSSPYGTISVTDCTQVEALARVMQRINAQFAFDPAHRDQLQALDGYSPVRFFDLGDYVHKLCTEPTLLAEFDAQLARTVPYERHTPSYYSAVSGGRVYPIRTFSGVTTSDPSTSYSTAKTQTAWWQATH